MSNSRHPGPVFLLQLLDVSFVQNIWTEKLNYLLNLESSSPPLMTELFGLGLLGLRLKPLFQGFYVLSEKSIYLSNRHGYIDK